ncbi:MAG: fibronectin type III-like domain-contianing protein [Actinomycetota bacterium]|nr:fibronectin type III-like domain-contianing protein [Actinomycetota bacterium]
MAVTNTGRRAASAAPQLYVGMPDPAKGIDQPPLQLKGFDRVALAPGETRRVRFALDERAFSYWDERADGWRVSPGCYRIVAGQHSRDAAVEGLIGRGANCGGALTLPRDARACTSRRAFTIRLRRDLRRATVTYAGRRAKAVRRGRRLRARIDLRGLEARRVVVRAVGRTRSGRKVRDVRVYRTCAKRRPPARG